MKTSTLKSAILFIIAMLSLQNYAQNISITDPNFENYLIAKGYDDVLDGYVKKENVKNINGLDLDNLNINSLQGIEGFSSLTWIYFRNNNIQNVNFSQNINLKKIVGENNALTNITLPQNNKIETLLLAHNQLTQLNISTQLNLTYFSAGNNNLTEINVKNNIKINDLSLNENNISEINLNNNTSIENLVIHNNNLNNLNISKLTKLRMLVASNNNLTSIDVSNNLELDFIVLFNNYIESFDMTTNEKVKSLSISYNNLKYLNIRNGKNTILNSINTTGNPNLECIVVDNANATPANWNYSNNVVLSETICSFPTPIAYPNPFISNINIGPANHGIETFQLFNSNGILVSQGNLIESKISTNNLSGGTYILFLYRNGIVVKNFNMIKNGRGSTGIPTNWGQGVPTGTYIPWMNK